jgi:23S rRNA (adenine2030-N6)-methyltransferase
MNYQHAYHAGNSADVFKHLVLMVLLDYLKQKEKPFCYIDTHAGEGEYDLTRHHSQEWQDGIGRLQQDDFQNIILKRYLAYAQSLEHFPGSPRIAKKLLRPQDEMILIEKSLSACTILKALFVHEKKVHIHHADAYQAVNAILPPPVKRGLILIDPPYEEKDEFDKLATLLQKAHLKFPVGMYALWYPIKSRTRLTHFYQAVKKHFSADILIIEFCPWPDDVALRLNGSGMMIVHPPWQIEHTLSPLLDILLSKLRRHPKGFHRFIY